MIIILFEAIFCMSGVGLFMKLLRLALLGKPGSMLQAGLLQLIHALFARFGETLQLLALVAGIASASFRQFLLRFSLVLGIASRNNSLLLILYHTLKIPFYPHA